MSILAPARGCVFSMFSRKSGFTKIPGLITGTGPYPILLHGPGASSGDVVQAVPRFDAKPLLYTFGKDVGAINLAGIILLGPSGSSAQGAAQLKSFFEANRISESGKLITVSAPGGSVYGVALTGLALGAVEPTFHTMDFSLRGHIIE